ncbi:hypothetical protein TNCV_3032571 [Trichonephila clavipes]|nr:hypothetical protein TNCV_3032571 [Trichonephila clavipes]
MIVSSTGTTNPHRTWDHKPHLVGENLDDVAVARMIRQTRGVAKRMPGFGVSWKGYKTCKGSTFFQVAAECCGHYPIKCGAHGRWCTSIFLDCRV